MGPGLPEKMINGTGVATFVLVLVLAGSAACASSAAAHRVAATPSKVRSYWTPRRISEAIPVDGVADSPPPSANATVAGERRRSTHKRVRHVGRYPFRTSGKVYFSTGGSDYQCSGTAVHSPSRSLVWTAGHCVYEQAVLGGSYVSHWEFIPAFTAHGSKYGVWPATSLATTYQYRHGGSVADDGSAHDFGVATVARRNGETLEKAVGSRKLAFGSNPRKGRLHAFGYPASRQPAEFTGKQLFRCDSRLAARDGSLAGPASLGIRCDMTGGASGGGWTNRHGKVVSVTSYGYPAQPGILFGPYQGSVARHLYNSVRR